MPRSATSSLVRTLFVCAAMAQLTLPAPAAESITPAGPIGGTDIRSALLPPPGDYGAIVGVGLEFLGLYTADSYVPSGNGSGMGLGGLGWLHVWDAEVLGGQIASSLFVGVQKLCFGVQRGPQNCASGLMDLYSDIFVWSKFVPSADFATQPQRKGPPIPYGTAYLVGFGTNLPSGTYETPGGLNTGSNVFTFSPNIGITHTTKSLLGPVLGEATEFSARAFFNFYTENDTTHYQTGPLISLDFAVTQRIEYLQYGIAGTGFVQVGDDKINGISIGGEGKHAANFNIGPLMAYDFMIGDRPYNLMGKWLVTVYGDDYTIKSEGLTLRLSTKLF